MTEPTGTILLVDDTPANLEVLVDCLTGANFEVLVATDGAKALDRLQHARPDLILLDVMMPGMDGFETCRRLKAQEATHSIPVIFMTALSDTADKVEGFAAGAVDYITKPLQHEEVLARVRTHLTLINLQRALQEANQNLEAQVAQRTADLQSALAQVEALKNRLQAENTYLRQEAGLTHDFEEIITQSPVLTQVLVQVEQVAPTDATVLILGETGTGKEPLARAVHRLSQRRDQPLVKVNCAALPANLIESELFGHEKGAFTGALARKIGRFELADKGTLFLDEIGELPLELQAKLLRVLQEGEFERLGNPQTTTVDVRIIAATNRDLEAAAAQGEFRQDLYYRLNVFPLQNPPLRQRKEDIPLLTKHFADRYGAKIGKPIKTIPASAVATLQAYDWPGNVRELENIVERAVIISRGDQLELGDWFSSQPTAADTEIVTLEDKERAYIHEILEATAWRIRGEGGAAQLLGLKPTTLEARMKKLEIERAP
ncbi:MAG: response regulator [Candidatus Latescibacteria bacterium]|nr:response regulator [Candidatus Latescibacterota bacterium]